MLGKDCCAFCGDKVIGSNRIFIQGQINSVEIELAGQIFTLKITALICEDCLRLGNEILEQKRLEKINLSSVQQEITKWRNSKVK